MADYKKPDYWQLKARKDGYPARSVYKLKEIDEKFGLFKKSSSFRALDLGAAPGSWSLYVLRKIYGIKNAFLAAADLSPLSREFDNDLRNRGLFDGDNFFFIQGDITTAEIQSTLFSKGPYSVIISDAAPSTTGSRIIDAAHSLELAEAVVFYAENALAARGNLALKIFQGGDSAVLLKHIKTLFKTAKSFKPEACRGESAEIYFIGLDKK